MVKKESKNSPSKFIIEILFTLIVAFLLSLIVSFVLYFILANLDPSGDYSEHANFTGGSVFGLVLGYKLKAILSDK